MAGYKLKLWSGPANIHRFYEGASQTFLEGDLVIISGGYIVIATDGADAWGVAAKSGSNTTAGAVSIPVYVITPEQVWSAFATGATPARATHVGNPYDLSGFTAGNNIRANLADTTNDDYIVQELDPRDTPASGSRVLIRFNASSCDAIGG